MSENITVAVTTVLRKLGSLSFFFLPPFFLLSALLFAPLFPCAPFQYFLFHNDHKKRALAVTVNEWRTTHNDMQGIF